MRKSKNSGAQRLVRHHRVRKRVIGTPDRPRLCVFRSMRHTYAQVIDDSHGHTLIHASSLELSSSKEVVVNRKTDAAGHVGRLVAERSRSEGINTVVFDRAGYKYHGRVKALAEAAREGGLIF